jgi:hypothetical protein
MPRMKSVTFSSFRIGESQGKTAGVEEGREIGRARISINQRSRFVEIISINRLL